MKPLNNEIIIAAAGSGKSTQLVEKALHYNNKQILITTFTIDNTKEIEKKFFKKIGYIPIAIKLSILNEKIPFFGYTSLGIN